MMAEEYYIFTGRQAVPRHVTRVRIDESLSVIPAWAFNGHQNIVTEVNCHVGVKIVREFAFCGCRSLRFVIMPGVEEIESSAFNCCEALADVQCDKLELIGINAFGNCESLRSVDLPSVKIVQRGAFINCKALANVKFGDKLKRLNWGAFFGCRSLEQLTLPLKDSMITDDNIFTGCIKLKHVDLVEGELHETMDALQMEEWRDFMNEEIESINQILSTTPAGTITYYGSLGRKAQAIKTWIRSVLHKIVHYKAEHHRYLNEAASTLQLALPNDIVCKNVLPFLELPSYTFELED